MWKCSVDVDEVIKNLSGLDLLERLYSLSVIWKSAVYQIGYTADSAWMSNLVLSSYGETILKVLLGYEYKNSPDLYLAMFCRFFHHEIFFDWEKTSADEIEKLLESEIRQGKIRFPFCFGRELYDKFNDFEYLNRTDHLLPNQVDHLLAGTPKGVFQVGYTLIGPLGVLKSVEARALYPQISLPLWHCSDTGCEAVHFVKLEPYKNFVEEIYINLNLKLKDLYGPRSEWSSSLRWMHRGGEWPNGKSFYNVSVLIGETILKSERKSLVVEILSGRYRKQVRDLLGKKLPKKFEGPASDLVECLDDAEQLQLLFTLSDEYLIEVIDDLVYRNVIKIPIGEKRTPQFNFRSRSKDQGATLSSRGVRSDVDDPVGRFISLIVIAYGELGIKTELEWKIRSGSVGDLRSSLFNYVLEGGVEKTVNELILSSSVVTTHICKVIKLSMDYVGSGDPKSCERMLWKLGFDPAEHDITIARIVESCRVFNEALLLLVPVTGDEDRQKIRSSAVNLFAYLEGFLELFISYNIWLLASDHFVDTKFCYEFSKAKEMVPKILGEKIESGNTEYSWSKSSGNTLGVLLIYLARASSWVASLADTPREMYSRFEGDLPHYATDDSLPFLFRHTQLWADSDFSELKKYSEHFQVVIKLVLQANLAEIRNGIDHYRTEESFPDGDKMLACVNRLREVFENVDLKRLFPKLYWLTGRESTRFGVIKYSYEDYAQRKHLIYGPPLGSGLPNKVYGFPVVIAPFNLLGYPNSDLIFWANESSTYSEYWDGYPRRRKIEPIVNLIPEELESENPINADHPIEKNKVLDSNLSSSN